MLKARQRLLPGSESKVKQRLSHLRKHINGMCQIARRSGATDGMINAALSGREDESFLCPVCSTPMVDSPMFKDENGDSFLECPSCNKEKKDV